MSCISYIDATIKCFKGGLLKFLLKQHFWRIMTSNILIVTNNYFYLDIVNCVEAFNRI